MFAAAQCKVAAVTADAEVLLASSALLQKGDWWDRSVAAGVPPCLVELPPPPTAHNAGAKSIFSDSRSTRSCPSVAKVAGAIVVSKQWLTSNTCSIFHPGDLKLDATSCCNGFPRRESSSATTAASSPCGRGSEGSKGAGTELKLRKMHSTLVLYLLQFFSATAGNADDGGGVGQTVSTTGKGCSVSLV